VPTQPTQPVTHVTCEDLLIEGEAAGIKAHQDWPSIQGSLDSLVVWIPFTEVNDLSYPIQILPRSHLDGLRESVIEKKGSIIKLTQEEEKNILDVVCSPGDALIFSTFTVHRTKTNIKNSKFRFSASTRFDNAIEKTFIDRNYPCAYKRSIEREISNPLSQETIKNFFNKK
jgi:ectoine hydroxylase-related dioxygenase (phytanoyl-CoA dioxygenase family)